MLDLDFVIHEMSLMSIFAAENRVQYKIQGLPVILPLSTYAVQIHSLWF